MEDKLKQVEETLNKLHDLQASHLEDFNKEELPDLERQSAERSHEVDKLMKSVNGIVSIVESTNKTNSESMVFFLNNKISTLLEQNKALEIKVQDFKEKMKKNMKKISTGKQAIGSYRSSAAVSNNPKVLSITN
jgi:ABC-type transporter Mla subunit MlaD